MIRVSRATGLLTVASLCLLLLGAPAPAGWPGIRLRTVREEPALVRMESVRALDTGSDYVEVGSCLGDLFDRLSKKHRVSLKAGQSRIADQKVIVFARGERTGVLLDQLAEVIGGVWRHESNQSYRLVLSRKARDEAARYQRWKTAELRLIRRARLKRYHAMVRAGVRNAQLPAGVSEDGPGRPFVRDAALAPMLRGLTRQQLDTLFTAGEAARRVRFSIDDRLGWELRRYTKEPAFSVPISSMSKADSAPLLKALAAGADQNGPASARYRAIMSDGELMVHFGNYDGEGVYLKITGSALTGWGPEYGLVHGADALDASPDHELNAGLTSEELGAFRRYYSARYGAQRSALPMLPGTVSGLSEGEASGLVVLDLVELHRLESAGRRLSLPSVLLLLHRATGRNVISDYYTKPQRLPSPEWHPRLGVFLRQFAEVFGRNVTVAGSTIRCRSRTWPDDDLSEVPLRLLRPWLEVIAKQGQLPADQWLAMAALSELQLVSLGPPSDIHGQALCDEARAALNGLPLLKFYNQLTPGQRLQTWGDGLTWLDLTAPLQEQAWRLVRRAKGPVVTMGALARSFRLTVRRIDPSDQVSGDASGPVERLLLTMIMEAGDLTGGVTASYAKGSVEALRRRLEERLRREPPPE